VVLVDESGQEVKTVGADGFPEDALEAYTSSWPAATQSDSKVLRALRAQKTYVIDNVRARNLANPLYTPIHHIVRRMEWDVVVATPIVYHDLSLGVLCSYFGTGTQLSSTEIDILTAIANHAAVAIENHRLYQEAQGVGALGERQRLARELHDSVSQALYGIGLGARTARTLVDRDPQKAIEPVEYVLSLVEIGLAEMRALIFELQPESLEAEGLVEALRKQVLTLPSRHEIEVDFADCDEPDLPLSVKEAVYRIAQEAIHNTVKHAQATALSIEIVCTDSELVLELHDNGRGFDTNGSFPGHLGLRSMRERAAKLDGEVRIESGPGQGVYVSVQIPIERYAQ
jgi:signal transduction histidine kinase